MAQSSYVPLLMVAAGAGLLAMAFGGGDARSGDDGPIPYRAAMRTWKQSNWTATVAQLKQEFDSPDQIAIEAAKAVFPGSPWPANASMHESNQKVWAMIKGDVFRYLGVVPTPARLA